jgi:hypothetical protein
VIFGVRSSEFRSYLKLRSVSVQQIRLPIQTLSIITLIT